MFFLFTEIKQSVRMMKMPFCIRHQQKRNVLKMQFSQFKRSIA